MQSLLQTLNQHMFHLPLPVTEKILRAAIVYLALIIFLRLFGKRELAQLNPFDLVVLLSLSNTVQNAIIGDDNSVTGGILGAFSLLAVNWLLMQLLYKQPRLTAALQGNATTLVLNGIVDEAALKSESLTHEELTAVLNRNGFASPAEVESCVLEPNGSFYVKGRTPNAEQVHSGELMDAIRKLTAEVHTLRKELDARG